MNKSLKKFLIWSQVLGLSALAATACTDNNTQTTSTAPATNNQTKEQAPNTNQVIDPSSSPDKEQSLKEKTIVKTAEITNGLVGAAVGAAVKKLIDKDPAHADQYESIADGIVHKAIEIVNDKKEQALVKEAEKQAQKEEAQAEGQGDQQGLTDKVKSKLKGIFHHGNGDSGPKKP